MRSRLNIVTIFPDTESAWSAGEPLIRERLKEHDVNFAYGESDAFEFMANAQVVLSFTFSEELARRAPNLSWVQGFGAGMESLLRGLANRPEVLLTSARGIHGASVAEACLAMMLALSRDLVRAVHNQSLGRWSPFGSVLMEGKTIGILGVGSIAESLARKCQGLGMRVVGITSALRSVPDFDELRLRSHLPAAVHDLDYLVLLSPLTEVTRGIIDAHVLASMKKSAFLINVGRGGLVNELALIEALQKRMIRGAALDTVSQEPLPSDHPLWACDNVLILPHNAGRHDNYVHDVLRIFEFNIAQFVQGSYAAMLNTITR